MGAACFGMRGMRRCEVPPCWERAALWRCRSPGCVFFHTPTERRGAEPLGKQLEAGLWHCWDGRGLGSRKGHAVCLSCRMAHHGDDCRQGGHSHLAPKQHLSANAMLASSLLLQNYSKQVKPKWLEAEQGFGVLGELNLKTVSVRSPLHHQGLLHCCSGVLTSWSAGVLVGLCRKHPLYSWVLGCRKSVVKVLHKEKKIAPRKSLSESMRNMRCDCDKEWETTCVSVLDTQGGIHLV